MDKITSLENYRRIQGARAQAVGGLFESMFLSSCKRSGIACTRFPDGCRTIGVNKIVRIKTPFDWIISYGSKTALVDTKTCDKDSFPHSKIETHQTYEMVRHQLAGTLSGYVIWLRQPNLVMFMPALTLQELAKTRGSIRVGAPHSKILGTHSHFDVRFLFN